MQQRWSGRRVKAELPNLIQTNHRSLDEIKDCKKYFVGGIREYEGGS